MKEVIAALQSYLGRDMRIIPERLERIPLTPSGKRRFTISKLNDLVVGCTLSLVSFGSAPVLL